MTTPDQIMKQIAQNADAANITLTREEAVDFMIRAGLENPNSKIGMVVKELFAGANYPDFRGKGIADQISNNPKSLVKFEEGKWVLKPSKDVKLGFDFLTAGAHNQIRSGMETLLDATDPDKDGRGINVSRLLQLAEKDARDNKIYEAPSDAMLKEAVDFFSGKSNGFQIPASYTAAFPAASAPVNAVAKEEKPVEVKIEKDVGQGTPTSHSGPILEMKDKSPFPDNATAEMPTKGMAIKALAGIAIKNDLEAYKKNTNPAPTEDHIKEKKNALLTAATVTLTQKFEDVTSLDQMAAIVASEDATKKSLADITKFDAASSKRLGAFLVQIEKDSDVACRPLVVNEQGKDNERRLEPKEINAYLPATFKEYTSAKDWSERYVDKDGVAGEVSLTQNKRLWEDTPEIPFYIETGAGSRRTYGNGGIGEPLSAHYGAVKNTKVKDGDDLDLYLDQDIENNMAFQGVTPSKVYIMQQMNATNPPSVDELKVGYFHSAADFEKAMRSSYKKESQSQFDAIKGEIIELPWDEYQKVLSKIQGDPKANPEVKAQPAMTVQDIKDQFTAHVKVVNVTLPTEEHDLLTRYALGEAIVQRGGTVAENRTAREDVTHGNLAYGSNKDSQGTFALVNSALNETLYWKTGKDKERDPGNNSDTNPTDLVTSYGTGDTEYTQATAKAVAKIQSDYGITVDKSLTAGFTGHAKDLEGRVVDANTMIVIQTLEVQRKLEEARGDGVDAKEKAMLMKEMNDVVALAGSDKTGKNIPHAVQDEIKKTMNELLAKGQFTDVERDAARQQIAKAPGFAANVGLQQGK